MGTVVRDAEAKISKSGKSYSRFTVRAGEGDAAQWISVMYFGADAAELAAGAVKGTRVYTEGALRLDTWEQDGKQRSGLSVMSWHCRLAEIGRNRPKPRERKPAQRSRVAAATPNGGRPFDDTIPFAPEWRG
jgi:single-stranded DNA-binding protein